MGFLAVAGFILSALNTAKNLAQGQPEEPGPGIPPASGMGGFGVPQMDLSEIGQLPQQTTDYSGGGSTFGQAMASYEPMRLGNVLKDPDQFSLGRRKRRF